MPKKAFTFNLTEVAYALQEKYRLPDGEVRISVNGWGPDFQLTVTYK